MFTDACRVFVHAGSLGAQVVGDGATEPWIGDPMRGMRQGRHETAGDLVLALRAGLEARDAVLDAVLDALVVAGLEVQAVELVRCAPVAAVERVAADEEHRDRDDRASAFGELEEQRVPERASEDTEALEAEVGLLAAAQKGSAVQLPRGEHLGGSGITAVHRAEGDAFLGDPAPLAACFLAFLCGEAGE